jgi:hypothetical protein
LKIHYKDENEKAVVVYVPDKRKVPQLIKLIKAFKGGHDFKVVSTGSELYDKRRKIRQERILAFIEPGIRYRLYELYKNMGFIDYVGYKTITRDIDDLERKKQVRKYISRKDRAIEIMKR